MKNWQNILLVVLLMLGLGLRLIDLTDPPLDFHPTRQYRGALIARSIYYDLQPNADPVLRAQAAEMRVGFEEFEPPVLETVVAVGYLLAGGEKLWIARLVVSLFWVLGGWGLFLLVRRTVSVEAGFVAVAYYLFLPFAVFTSRSFQPDPVMTVWLIFTAYAGLRWAEESSWRWALGTAAFAVLAVMAKVVAAYMIIGLMVALVLWLGLKRAIRNPQVWVMGALMVALPALYYLLAIGESSSSYFKNWMVALMPLVLEKSFYTGWLRRLFNFNKLVLPAAGLGVLVFSKGVGRWMLFGLTIGYAVYSFTLPHQTMTHSYYHIQLILVVAWAVAYAVQWAFDWLSKRQPRWQTVLLAVFLLGSLYPAYAAAEELLEEDHRHEPPFWEYIGNQVPIDGQTIGLVQQYGHMLMYYGWQEVALWPTSGELYLAEMRGNPDVHDFETYFAAKTAGMDYFLVTSFKQFKRQEELYSHMYENYPVYRQEDSFVIFDLLEQGTN